MKSITLVRRKEDGTMFRASCPDNYTAGQAFADVLSGKMSWYFHGVKYEIKRFFIFEKGRWVDTGEIWQPTDPHDFEVIGEVKINAPRP